MRFKITEHTFGLEVKFQVGGDLESALKSCESWTGACPENAETLDDSVMGWALTYQSRSFVWLMEWPETDDTIGTLVHEVVHVAHGFLQNHIGEIDQAEETLCHLVQYLYRSALRKLKKYDQRKNVGASGSS